MCVKYTVNITTYDTIACDNDRHCPQTAVCGQDRFCTTPHYSSHTCGNGLYCGPSAECREGKCRSLYNYARRFKDCSM